MSRYSFTPASGARPRAPAGAREARPAGRSPLPAPATVTAVAGAHHPAILPLAVTATEVSEPGPCTRLGYISGPLHPGPLHTAMIIMTLTRTRVKACKFELASFSCKLDSQVLKLDHCSSTDLCLLITLFCIDQN